jgi:hypothetical protein
LNSVGVEFLQLLVVFDDVVEVLEVDCVLDCDGGDVLQDDV